MANEKIHDYTEAHVEQAEANGISYNTFTNRIYKGWSPDEAATQKVRPQNKVSEEEAYYKQVAKQNNIKYVNFKNRLKMGWSAEKAATTPVYKKRITPEIVERASKNGINYDLLENRLNNGWSVERAVSQPKKGKDRVEDPRIPKDELIELLGRVKYLRNIGVAYPPPITKLMQKRMDEYGIAYDDVEEVYVESEAFEEVRG